MGNIKKLRSENKIKWLGHGTALDAPFVSPLQSSIISSKGGLPGTFTRSTTGTYVDSDGVIQTAAIDDPRFEYENGQPKGILIEEQRTNLFTYSEALDNTDWVKGSNTTITANQAIAPDGTLTADRLQFPASSGTFIREESLLSINTTYTLSVWAKAVSSNSNFVMRIENQESSQKTATSEWQRFEFTANVDGTVSADEAGFNNGNDSFVTDIYIWGAQLEAGEFATSYIPTEATAVTRTVDILNYDVTNTITQGQGSIYCEIEIQGQDTGETPYVIDLSDGTSNNNVKLLFNTDSDLRAEIVNSTASQGTIDTSPLSAATLYKVVLTYETDSFKLFVNGSKIGEDTSATIPTSLTTLNIGSDYNDSSQLNGTVKNVKYYSKVLDEATAERLTS